MPGAQGANSWDMVHTSTFWLKFDSSSPPVTLKIRSRSPKPNQLIMSRSYIHANSLKIHPSVHPILCIQESVMATGFAPKTMSPSPLVGDITIQKLQRKCHLKLEHRHLIKISVFHTYLYLFNYPIIIYFVHLYCSLGIKFCSRHELHSSQPTRVEAHIIDTLSY